MFKILRKETIPIKSAEEMLLENGYEDVVILSDFSYDFALIGVTSDERAVYDFEKMVDWLVKDRGMSDLDAVEWIEYNTIRALPYAGSKGQIVVYPLSE